MKLFPSGSGEVPKPFFMCPKRNDRETLENG